MVLLCPPNLVPIGISREAEGQQLCSVKCYSTLLPPHVDGIGSELEGLEEESLEGNNQISRP